MVTIEVPPIERRRMPYEEWRAFPEKPKSEWVDGEVVIVNVPPSLDHSDGAFWLRDAIRRDLPDVRLYNDVPLRLPRNRVRRPDLMAFDMRPAGEPLTEVPFLVVEVLLPRRIRSTCWRRHPNMLRRASVSSGFSTLRHARSISMP